MIYPHFLTYIRTSGVKHCPKLFVVHLLLLSILTFLFASAGNTRASTLTSNLNQTPTSSAVKLNSVPSWESVDADYTSDVAWGDMDGDGDLDLAVGCRSCPNKVYRNDDGVLQPFPVWSSTDTDDTLNVAWGDVDNDGDLDLAAGCSACPIKVYRNDGRMLQNDYAWYLDISDTSVVEWGDMNGDGRFDLAVGGSNKVFLNTGITLETAATWSSKDNTFSSNISWGDVNGDGRLDLVMLSNIYEPTCDYAGEVKVYLNKNGTLGSSAFWRYIFCGEVTSMALGDVNGDGAPDLAISYAGWATTVHLNNRLGKFQTSKFWLSADSDFNYSLAWGDVDGDGDLDLAEGGESGDKVYVNTNGKLQETPAWTTPVSAETLGLAWGDVDNDGDLDLATGKLNQPNALYINEIGKFQKTPIWSSSFDFTSTAAWGDVNGDGALDLMLDWFVYLNRGATLSPTPDWYPTDNSSFSDIAWGDMDGDGDLDLAIGGSPTRIYLNTGAMLESTAVWSSTIDDPTVNYPTNSVAWGDVDGDGDLDLATGNEPRIVSNCYCDEKGGENVYRNQAGKLESTPFWTSSDNDPVTDFDNDRTTDVAWGDMDGDGDLDLAVGNFESPSKIYLNIGGTLQMSPAWVSQNKDYTQSIAWGDVDGDGDLDLATGNRGNVNRVYRNNGHRLETTASWTSLDTDNSNSIVWSDIDSDGDLDLVVGNDEPLSESYIKVYINQQGDLLRQSIPLIEDVGSAEALALGDLDEDGDFDLVVANRAGNSKVYQNQRPAPPYYSQLQNKPASITIDLKSNTIPTFNGQLSNALSPAAYYAVAGIRQSGSIPITYNLFSPNSAPVQAIRVYYSLEGSFSGNRAHWQVARPAIGTQTTDLSTSPYPTHTVTNTHIFKWDVFGSGFFGQSANVVVRIEALPTLKPIRNGVPGPFQRAYVSTQTFPFRVRGTQVRVVQATPNVLPIPGATIYRLPGTQTQDAVPYLANNGTPLSTDPLGYLQGRGSLTAGDQLFALVPITATEKYTVYHTSGTVTEAGLESLTVSAGGVQTLTVSAANTLVLYNLIVSLEWDARNDSTFMTQLENDLRRTSQILFDLTNGQAALGDVRIYHDKGFWGTADVVITASNNQRPNAILGGSVLTPTADVDVNGAAIPDAYVPGQVRMGATWNRFGNPNGTLGEDWPRTLAHELGHYLFFVPDNYIGVTPDRQFVQLVDCQGSVMTDPYEESYSEFLTAEQWQSDACQRSVAAVYLGRPDWATITRFYPMLNGRGGNPGPSQLPLAVTRITTFAPPRPAATLGAPFFPLVNQQGQTISVPDGRGQAYLFKTGNNSDPTDDYLIALGAPIGDLVQARGAAPGDRLCVFDYSQQPLRLGCLAAVGNTPTPVTLSDVADWAPQVQVSGVSTNTVVVTVTNVSASNLTVQLLPALGVASPEMPMTQQGSAFVQTVTAVDGAYFGFVRIWAPGSNPLKEMIVEYSANEAWDGRARAWGGSLDAWGGRARAWGGRSYGWGGRARAWGAPVMSSDGQVSIFPLDNPFAGGAHYTLQTVAFPPALPAWLTPVGQAYRVASDGTLARSAILFSYLGRDVPDGYENVLTVYYSPDEGRSWQRLPTDLDTNRNQASAPVMGEGIYLLVATVAVKPALSQGWNNFGYPVQATQPTADALGSIAGNYTVVYHSDPTAPSSWRTFDPAVPAPFAPLVNDLQQLEFSKAYWLHARQPVTLYLGVGSVTDVTASNLTESLATPPPAPATFYGWLIPASDFAPTTGMRVTALIDGVVCGESQAQELDGKLAYVIRVSALAVNNPGGCGSPGKSITFVVGDRTMAQVAIWNNAQTTSLSLSSNNEIGNPLPGVGALYLPLIRK